VKRYQDNPGAPRVRRPDGAGFNASHAEDDMTDGPDGGPGHGPSFIGARNKTYQNTEVDDAGDPADYLGGPKQQTVPAQGPGFQPVRQPVAPSDPTAKAFADLQNHLAKRRMSRARRLAR
jgi:hypothetical protein